MAKVRIVHQWPDGGVTIVTVKADTSYPDALAEAKRIALDAFAEAVDSLAGTDDE